MSKEQDVWDILNSCWHAGEGLELLTAYEMLEEASATCHKCDLEPSTCGVTACFKVVTAGIKSQAHKQKAADLKDHFTYEQLHTLIDEAVVAAAQAEREKATNLFCEFCDTDPVSRQYMTYRGCNIRRNRTTNECPKLQRFIVRLEGKHE